MAVHGLAAFGLLTGTGKLKLASLRVVTLLQTRIVHGWTGVAVPRMAWSDLGQFRLLAQSGQAIQPLLRMRPIDTIPCLKGTKEYDGERLFFNWAAMRTFVTASFANTGRKLSI